MYALVLICISQQTKFEVPSFTDSKEITGAKILKRVTSASPGPLGGSLSSQG